MQMKKVMHLHSISHVHFTFAGVVMLTENAGAFVHGHHLINNWADSGSDPEKAGYTYGTINF